VTRAALTAGGLVEVKADCDWAARLLAGVLTGAFILLVVGVQSILSSREFWLKGNC